MVPWTCDGRLNASRSRLATNENQSVAGLVTQWPFAIWYRVETLQLLLTAAESEQHSPGEMNDYVCQ